LSNPAEIIVGGSGSTSISVDSTGGQSIVVSPVGSTSVSVGSIDSQSISITSSSTEVTVSSPDAQSVSVTNSPITVEVYTGNSPDIGIKRLRDLEDVIGDPTSGQVLVYNEGENNFQFEDQQAGGGGGGGDDEELTDYAITVTNTDGAFSTIKDFTYEKFTSMTDILNDILNPYTKASVSLTNLSGTLGGNSYSKGGGSHDIEVGRNLILNSVSYSVSDPDKIKDDTLRLTKDAGQQQNLDETNTTNVSLDPIISAQHNTPHSDLYQITCVDNGNPNGQEYTTNSNAIIFRWKYRVSLKATNSIPSSNAEASALWATPSSDTLLLNDPGSNSFDLECDEDNAANGFYTMIMYPSSYGTLKSVLQNNSTDTTADFVLVGQFTVTTNFGVSADYYIYRTNDTGAYNDGITLTITLN